MTCKRCTASLRQYPLYKGHRLSMGAIQCAFPDGKTFSPDNWNCETMTALRTLAGEQDDIGATSHFHAHHRWDDHTDSIGVLAIPDVGGDAVQSGYLVMTWYKSHGTTGQAWVMWDDNEPQRLTLATAEAILDEQGKRSNQ